MFITCYVLGTVLDSAHTLFHLVTQKSYKVDAALIFQVKKQILKEAKEIVDGHTVLKGWKKDLLSSLADISLYITLFDILLI